ncbi:F0F1 ATP synthase subunit B family protein [Oceanibaculum pacificum]|uniref:ATP synthase subunit b n=1 Tax=Oceanibaculum pacificum TaxID=580166 RepID=A0A154WG36_9PROT|nr:F0F1 ATP synthase subunit B' [Oceanibaculum pacificum]KZD12490.1 ATP synthase subunit B [Oceanibaculum pacificum]
MSVRSVKRAAAGFAALALTAAPAFAQDGGAGLPQLDTNSFATQIFWLAVTFVALYLLMSRIALPRVRDVLEERDRRIADDLEKAEKLKEEAEAVLAEYEKALADARSQAQAAMAEATEKANAEAAKRQQALADTLAAQVAEAETRIGAAKREALENVRQVAVEVSREATLRLIGGDIAEADAAKAVDAALKESA